MVSSSNPLERSPRTSPEARRTGVHDRARIGASGRARVNRCGSPSFSMDVRSSSPLLVVSSLCLVIGGCGGSRRDAGFEPADSTATTTAAAREDVASSDLAVPSRRASAPNGESTADSVDADADADDADSDAGCWRLDEFRSTGLGRVVRPPPVPRRPISVTVTVLESDGTVFSGPVGLTRIVATASVGSETCRGGTGGIDVARDFSLVVPHLASTRVAITITAWTPDETRMGQGFSTLPSDPNSPCAVSIRLDPPAGRVTAFER